MKTMLGGAFAAVVSFGVTLILIDIVTPKGRARAEFRGAALDAQLSGHE